MAKPRSRHAAASRSTACSAHGADLDLLGRAGSQELLAVDAGGELRRVAEHALHAQHVRDQVVGEERELAEIAECAGATPAEGQRQVGAGDLGALVEGHADLPVAGDVRVARHSRERADERVGGAARGLDRPREPAAEVRAEEPAEVREGARELRHERRGRRVAGLPEERSAAVAVEARELRRRRRARRSKALAEARRDGEVAGLPGELPEHREPARAEVDRVQRDHVGERRLVRPERVVAGIEVGRPGTLARESAGQRLEPGGVDRDAPRAPRHLGRGAADLGEDAHAAVPTSRIAPGRISNVAGRRPSGSPSISTQGGSAPSTGSASSRLPRSASTPATRTCLPP